MALLSHLQMNRIPSLYSQEEAADPLVYLFIRSGRAFWLITECDSEGLAFGWCDLYGDGSCGELGYVDLSEIESIGKDYFIAIKEVEITLSEAKKVIYK
jgi:hypothetical protein